jgi:hypothetical protein
MSQPSKARKDLFNGAPLVPGNPGNTGGKKGRSRPLPQEVRELCRQLWYSPAAIKSLEAILADDRHPHWAHVWKELGNRAFGKADQPITGPGGGPIQHELVRIYLPDNGRDDRAA